METFTWIPFYKELAQELLEYQDRQNELIDFLGNLKQHGYPSISLNDKDVNNEEIKLDSIDPFTFFAAFNRGITDENRIQILQEAKNRFGINSDVPADFSGIPVVSNMRTWFFAFKKFRKDNDIPLLWEVVKEAIHSPENLGEDLFTQCLQIKGVSITNLSMGLFWINPKYFSACDSRMKKYLINRKYHIPKIKNYNDYKSHLIHLKTLFPEVPFHVISNDAWEETNVTNEPEGKYNPETPKSKIKYWMYAPGPKAKMWEEFYNKGIMAIEWDVLGNLKEYPDKAAITLKLQETSGEENPGSKKNDSTACDEFANKILVGDIVFVKSKQQEIVGYGVVKSDYYFDSERNEYKSCRNVEWKTKGNWQTDFNLVQKTLTDVTKYGTDHPDYEKYSEQLMAILNNNYTPYKKEPQKIEHSLNQILYGPPGTGKTYNSINHALAIIEGKILDVLETESEENREEVLKRYKAFVAQGQILFTTFHQSMCYEDFIEGIKPVEIDYKLNYELKDGIFKTISENAFTNYKSHTEQLVKKSFDEVWNNLLKPLNEDEPVKVQMKKSSYEITHVNDKTIFFKKDSGESKHTLSINTLKAMYNEGENNIIKGGLQPYYEPLLNELLKGSEQAKKEELRNYVLVIDEINRGNVSQIFGELITLIEKDKRVGAKEELTVTLPYSKKKGFGVPSNLYIIGTMNTADRSVEALDAALRRRFTFIEMPPNYDLPQLEIEVIEGVTLLTILKTINNRIEKLLDKDHLIGHSYFLEIEEKETLKKVMQFHIIPLLQEYFYGDVAKIGLVLGEAFFEKEIDAEKTVFAKYHHDAIDDLNARPVIRLKQFWKEGEFEQAILDLVNPG